MRLLLQRGASVNAKNWQPQPLILAVFGGNCEVVKEILKWGADIDNMGLLGETALHVATDSPDTAILQVLLDNGATAGIVDFAGQSAAQRAMEYGDEEMAKAIMKYEASTKAEG